MGQRVDHLVKWHPSSPITFHRLPAGDKIHHPCGGFEFAKLRVNDQRFDPWFLWGYLRSAEVRARLLSKATGISRHRVSWDFLKQLPVPLVDRALQSKVSTQYQKALLSLREAEHIRQIADASLSEHLDLDNEWALQRLRAAKPPK